MPPLPKQNKSKEADAGILFRRWIEKNPKYSCAVELKQTEGDSLPFSAVTDEQIAWALAISSPKGALVRVQGLRGEPDYIWCRNMPSYVVIRFPGAFYVIPIRAFLIERDMSKRKSLTEDRALWICEKEVLIAGYPHPKVAE